MRQLPFIFFLAVAFVGLTSTTCQDREPNPRRPFDIDTTDNNPGGGGGTAKGKLTVLVSKLQPGSSNPAGQAEVRLHLTNDDAKAGTNVVVRQFTGSDGYTTFEWDPGTYYVVADWTLDGVKYTSDTTHVKGWGPPPTSFANGPELVTINKDLTKNINAVVDLRE